MSAHLRRAALVGMTALILAASGPAQIQFKHHYIDADGPEVVARAGEHCIVTGHRASRADPDGTLYVDRDTGGLRAKGSLVVGADGIHSTLRANMYPDEGAPY